MAITFGGNMPKVFLDSQTLTVSINGMPSYNILYNDPSPQPYMQWYQSLILPEGMHNITQTHMAGTALDYMVITAGQNTPLTGKTVIVNNEDSIIMFTGSWVCNTDRSHTYPFHNSTHQSTTPEDSFIFQFWVIFHSITIFCEILMIGQGHLWISTEFWIGQTSALSLHHTPSMVWQHW